MIQALEGIIPGCYLQLQLKATRTKITFKMNYKMDCQAGNIINFLKQVHTVDKGLSFKPYKQIISVKLLNNFSNIKPNDPYGFKEEIKINYNAVLVVIEKFPNGTGVMMKLLKAEPISFTWANYCAIPVAGQTMWEERGNAVTKALLLLLNPENNNGKNNPRRAYS